MSPISPALAGGFSATNAVYFTCGHGHVPMLFSQIIAPTPSLRVQKSELYICVPFAALHVIVSIVFLNSIHMRQYTISIFLFLIYFTLYDRFWLHPPH